MGNDLSVDLKKLLKQDPENQIIFTSNPQDFKSRYKINKQNLLDQGIFTIEQLVLNKNAQRMIMTEVEAEQFVLAYNYRNNQKKEPLSAFSFGDSGYTFRLELQSNLSNGRNVLVIGERGSGKSTLINALCNSLLIDYPDRFRYHISEYDQMENIQECDLDVQNVKFKFLEVIGYGLDIEKNQTIMLSLYEHLQQNQIEIDCILICRRFAYQTLNKRERQIIFHLSEIFRQSYIQKCFLVNTNYDLGNNTQIHDLLRTGLNSINYIYDRMPEPKILFVNSLITPFEGITGASRFKTVQHARDEINRLIDTNNQRIAILNLEAFKYIRNIEILMKQLKNEMITSFIELLPCLENYFTIFEINQEDDDLFYINIIAWSSLVQGERQTRNLELSSVLDDIILPDNIIANIDRTLNQQQNLGGIDRLNRTQRQLRYVEQFLYLKNRLTEEKTNRIENIFQLANDYINEQQYLIEQTYLQQSITREQLISTNMNNQLIQFFQQDPQIINEQLREEYHQIKEVLYFPNVNLMSTQFFAP